MSHIVHNCVCGHPVDLHTAMEKPASIECCDSKCGCTGKPEPAESAIMRTITISGEETPIERPGGPFLGMAMFKSCSCDECVALYNQVRA